MSIEYYLNIFYNYFLQCPVCSMRFEDPVSLVSHFEHAHNNSATTTAAASNSGNKQSCLLTQ
jgi:uncharacterized C2H2 Zn-finger protein